MKTISMMAVTAMALVSTASAQINYSEYIQSGEAQSYPKTAVHERDIVQYPSLREADVKYCKRIVSCIDGRQKQNKLIEWPGSPLSKVLYEGILSGELVAYKNDSLSPASFYNIEQMAERSTYKEILLVPDSVFEDEFHEVTITNFYNYEDMHKFWIMEDWIFDYKYGVFKPRIIAIAPLFKPKMQGMPDLPEMPWCWIRMDNKLRLMLARQEVFNTYNDAARLSYDDFFQMHMFGSYVIKESNVSDLQIRQFEEYKENGIAALLEGDRIKNDLFIFEHDLWQY